MVFWFHPRKVNDPNHPAAYANGAFMLLKRSCYEAIGGHDAVRTEVNEDMHMARFAKERGQRLCVVQNEDLYTVRMYAGFRETWDDALSLQARGVQPAEFTRIQAPVTMIHGDEDPHPGRMIYDSLAPFLRNVQYREVSRCGRLCHRRLDVPGCDSATLTWASPQRRTAGTTPPPVRAARSRAASGG